MRRIIESVLVLLVLASVAGQAAAQASSPSSRTSVTDTVHVAPPTGQPETDRARVQEAFDRVGPGDTVLFAHGTYVLGEGARLTVPDVTVLGHPDGTVLRGCDPERFELVEGFGMDDVYAIGWGCTGLFVLADRQTIRGLTFDHTWHGIYVGHLLSPTGEPPTEPGFGGHRIENNVFRHVPNGIRVVGPTDAPTVIRDNEVVNAYHAFQSNGAIVHVIDNRITVPEPETVPAAYYPESAVMLSPAPLSGSCQGSRVVGNVVDGTVHGIQVLAGGARGTCSDHEIRDNVIRIRQVPLPTGYPRHLRDFYFGEEAQGSAVAGTAIRLNGEVLGPADGGAAAITDVVIQDNRVVGGDGLGIQLSSASGNRIVGNHISAIRRRSPFPGLTWGDDPNRWREANGSGIWISPGSDENEIVGNTFEDIAGHAVFLEGDRNRVETRSASDAVRDLGTDNLVIRADEAGEAVAPATDGPFLDRDGGPNPASLEALYDRIEGIRQEVGAPSAQVAILTPEETVLWNFGVADPSAGTPVTDETMFRAGSISKSFAGISLLMLVERDLLRLDDELRGLAPELDIRNPWRVSHPVRLSHLLEAGAGFVGFQGAGDRPDDPPDILLDRVIEELPYRLDVQWRPGDYTVYHNLGPVITAYLVEKLTGEPYEDFVRKNIFLPLGMDRSTFFRTETVAESLAWAPFPERPGASEDEGGSRSDPATHYEHIRARPSGALNTSAAELAAFVRMLLDRGAVDGRQILRRGTVERFETPTSTVAARKLAPGRGHAVNNWTSTYEGILYHGHGGRIDRYTAYYAYSPERGTGFVYMGTRGASGEELHYPVSAAILEALHPEAESPPVLETTAEQRSNLIGCYELVNPRTLGEPLRHLRVRSDGDRLLLDLPPVEDTPGYTTELELWKQPSLFRLRKKRPERGSESPWTNELAFVTDDRGVLIAEFLSFPHDAYERVPCPEMGAGGADPEVEGAGRR